MADKFIHRISIHRYAWFLIALFVLASKQGSASNKPVLACQGLINFSLEADCSGTLTINHVLIGGPYPGQNSFLLTLRNRNGVIIPGNVFTRFHLRDTFFYSVYDPISTNSCWGKVFVEDKTPPLIICPGPRTIACTGAIPNPQILGFPNGLILGTNVRSIGSDRYEADAGTLDGCENTTISFSDVISTSTCSNEFWQTVQRTWSAKDASGNVVSCIQNISMVRTRIINIIWPSNRDDIQVSSLDCRGSWDTNNNGFPDISETGSPLGTGCNIECVYSDQIINICTGSFKVIRKWTCLDWCNGEYKEHNQIIKITDKVSPVVEAPDDRTVSMDPNSCMAHVALLPARINDACSNIKRITITSTNMFGQTTAASIFTNGGFMYNLALGIHIITYETEDSCGNIGRDEMRITVVDKINPVSICKTYLTIGLGLNGKGRILASDIDNGSYDNCAITKRQVRRMSSACGLSSLFRDSVEFCCDDVNKKIPVNLRVWDNEGNYNDCMDSILVQDKLPPGIVCPSDISINCAYIFDVWNLEEFGKVVNGNLGQTRDSIILANGSFVGYNGIAYDNCNISISQSSAPQLNCGTGYISRTFTATETSGQSRNCVQTIRIIDTDPMDENDISWPPNYTTAACGTNLDTSKIPHPYKKPIFFDDNCSQPGISYVDWVFDFEAGCKKIIRKWTVIDWCQKNSVGNYLTFTRDQEINIINTIAPKFDACLPVLHFCPDNDGCSEFPVVLKTNATDDCTDQGDIRYQYSLDLYSDLVVDKIENSSDARGLYPLGRHKILWTAEDGCGNKETCQQEFIVSECKKPSPVCLVNVAFELMPTGMIQVCAKSLISPSTFDNCTTFDRLKFSFSSNTSDSCRIYTCEDINWNIETIWVTDEAGNQDFCQTVFLIQDNMRMCPDASLLVKGTISREDNIGLTDVNVEFSRDGFSKEMTTDSSGLFRMDSLIQNISYRISPRKLSNPRNGVNTADIIALQKHILGLERFSSPYQWIAGDVNADNKLTAADLIEMRKLVLLKIDRFSNTNSWRFVDKKQIFDELQPLTNPLVETLIIHPTSNISNNNDFIAIKSGDINNDAITTKFEQGIESRGNKILTWTTFDQELSGNGYEVRLPIYFTQPNIEGYQFSFSYDKYFLQPIRIESGIHSLTSENYHIDLERGFIHFQNSMTSPLPFSKNQPAFYIVFKNFVESKSLSSIVGLNNQILQNIAYDSANEPWTNKITFKPASEIKDLDQFELFQNQPNPWVSNTVIKFSLPKSMEVQLMIYDVTGKIIKTIEEKFESGLNRVTIRREDLPQGGVIYYQLVAGGFSDAKRMIILE